MFSNSVLGRSQRIIAFVAVCSISILLASCFQESQLPKDVQDALTAYWQSLPSASKIEHQITRAWPGETSNINFGSLENEEEVWCVETEISSAEDFSLIGEKMVWIVFRGNEETSWSAYLLTAMSSIWPYEACQQQGFLN